MGRRASGRVLEKSHVSSLRWEQRLATQQQQWNPSGSEGASISVAGDEVDTGVGENLAQQLWKFASVYLKSSQVNRLYGHRKVWQERLEVAIQIKGCQGHRRVEWVKPEHPDTALSSTCEVHANHVAANNSALRRRCSACRRRQNLYAKTWAGLQRALTVQRFVDNWVRPHQSLEQNTTPAMALGL
jgi:hypothetical protein